MAGYELRQAVLHLDEGRALSGRTAEVVQELRNVGGYRGIPVPFAALEQRAGETIASGVVNPVQTQGIIDRLFPASVAARMPFLGHGSTFEAKPHRRAFPDDRQVQGKTRVGSIGVRVRSHRKALRHQPSEWSIGV